MSECELCGQEMEFKEYAEFKPTTQKARKDYRCHTCKLPIKKGETYIRQSGVDYLSEKHFTVQRHQHCSNVKELLVLALEKVKEYLTRFSYAVYFQDELCGVFPCESAARDFLDLEDPQAKERKDYKLVPILDIGDVLAEVKINERLD